MKKLSYIFSALLLGFSFSSCEKEFLEAEPTDQFSNEQIRRAAETDPSVINGYTRGLYSLMYNTGTGGTNLDHDDFGQKGYDIYSDMLSSDMVLGATNYGWYSQLSRYIPTKDFTNTGNYKPWRYYYRIIFAANTLIEELGGNDAEPETAEFVYAMGQAKAMRAYAYFYLAQFYAKGYGSGQELILPLYTDTQVPPQSLSSAADVYNQMVLDLEDAIRLLEGYNRTAKNEVNQPVAKGLLAYVLAARGTSEDLQRVVTLTDEIIASGGSLMSTDYLVAKFDADGNLVNGSTAGFNDVTNPSWMWGVDLTLDNNLDLVSWWGQVDVFTYSYAWAGDPKIIDSDLYDQIENDDVRKYQFDTGYSPSSKFFAPDRRIGGQRQITTDYVYMRLEEMYLLNAEANARLGNDAAAKTKLEEIMEIRKDDISYISGLSGQSLLDEIYLQTRIEFWGEGKSYLAMKRLQKDVTRGANHLYFAGETFAWDSDELTFPIPQAEILNNPEIN